MIRGLHHNAYRCRDSEETRRSTRTFSDCRSPAHWKSTRRKPAAGRAACCIRSIVWTTAPISPSSKHQRWRSSSSRSTISICTSRSKSRRRICRRCSQRAGAGYRDTGVSDHGFLHSIYFRDPNGYVIELTAKLAGHDAEMDPEDERRARKTGSMAGVESADRVERRAPDRSCLRRLLAVSKHERPAPFTLRARRRTSLSANGLAMYNAARRLSAVFAPAGNAATGRNAAGAA